MGWVGLVLWFGGRFSRLLWQTRRGNQPINGLGFGVILTCRAVGSYTVCLVLRRDFVLGGLVAAGTRALFCCSFSRVCGMMYVRGAQAFVANSRKSEGGVLRLVDTLAGCVESGVCARCRGYKRRRWQDERGSLRAEFSGKLALTRGRPLEPSSW